jgi:DNA end-binding protein Ku
MLHKADRSSIKYDRVCEAEGVSVPWNEIVRGYEYRKGEFVEQTRAGGMKRGAKQAQARKRKSA